MSKKVLPAASICSLLVLAGPAFAGADQTGAPAPATSNTNAPVTADNPNEVICHMEEPITGSRLGSRRRCLTRQQWDQLQTDSQKTISGVQQRGLQGAPPGN